MTYTVVALVTVPSSLDYGYYGSDEFVLNSETFCQDTGTDCVMSYAFDTTDESNAAMEAFLQDYTENQNPQLDYESQGTFAAEFSGVLGMFLLLGGALSFIVGLVGVLNFFNAILTGILARRREFAVLQSIGMTGRQLKGMLIWEGGLLCPQRGGLWRRAGAGHGPPSWGRWRRCSGSSPTTSPWCRWGSWPPIFLLLGCLIPPGGVPVGHPGLPGGAAAGHRGLKRRIPRILIVSLLHRAPRSYGIGGRVAVLAVSLVRCKDCTKSQGWSAKN